MKMMPTIATTPDTYTESLSRWQRAYVVALRTAVRSAAPALREQLKWGHLVYLGSTAPCCCCAPNPSACSSASGAAGGCAVSSRG